MALIAASCWLVASSTGAVQPSNAAIEAFTATYHHAPPIIRQVEEPDGEGNRIGQPAVTRTVTMSVTPGRLIPLDHFRYALLIHETDQEAAHAFPGAISIAHLDRTAGGWKLDRLWPEVAFMGAFGAPVDKPTRVEFWSETIALESSTYCGMGSCEEDIEVFRLGKTAPRLLGSVPGGARYMDIVPGGSCETYSYGAKVRRPTSASVVMSVEYSGWTAPPGRTRPKRRFRRLADFRAARDALIAIPPLRIPDCGK